MSTQQRHILSVLVENKPGVLSRVTGLVSRRGFNIESLSVGPTEDQTLSRLTIIMIADDVAYEQITKQLHKLISVHKITDLTQEQAIERELVLFKVHANPERRGEIIEIANVFRANIVDDLGYRRSPACLWHQGDYSHGYNCNVPRLQGELSHLSCDAIHHMVITVSH